MDSLGWDSLLISAAELTQAAFTNRIVAKIGYVATARRTKAAFRRMLSAEPRQVNLIVLLIVLWIVDGATNAFGLATAHFTFHPLTPCLNRLT
jgi:hypothetical protein